jgi:hypothetical protein
MSVSQQKLFNYEYKIAMYGFDFLPFYPYFLLLVIKGQFFPEQKLCFRVYFFSVTKM